MSAAARPDVVIGPFRLDRLNRRLTHDGVAVRLGGRALDVLEVLAAAAGETVTKHALLDQVWPGLIVEEKSRSQSAAESLISSDSVPCGDRRRA